MELACLLLKDFLKKPVTLYALNTLVEIVLVIKEDKTRPTNLKVTNNLSNHEILNIR